MKSMQFNWRKPIIYSLLYLSGNKIPLYLKQIKKIAQASVEEKKKYQEQKLIDLLQYAYKHVPYYTKILSGADVIRNGDVRLENFQNIPLLTKEILREQKKNLYSDEKRDGIYENTSGGSTGEPVRFMQDKVYDEWNKANKIYYKLVAGQDVGEKELRFWGSERDLLEGKESLKIRARNWLYNRKEFNTFKMSEEMMRKYVDRWNEYEPEWVESYVQSIYEFARFIEKNNLMIKSPENGILTSAGTLYPEMRQTLERVFKCKVYNRYGSREVGDMACGTGELKISFWNQKIEVVENGRIIVTNLNNFVMPLIRYDIGDIGEIYEMKIRSILGRVNNMIKTVKGIVDSAAITSALYFNLKGEMFTSFSRYQLIQIEINKFILKMVVKDYKRWEVDKTDIRNVLCQILGDDIELVINEVDTIDSSKNGKYEYITSEIK